jgi:hypothetical protein
MSLPNLPIMSKSILTQLRATWGGSEGHRPPLTRAIPAATRRLDAPASHPGAQRICRLAELPCGYATVVRDASLARARRRGARQSVVPDQRTPRQSAEPPRAVSGRASLRLAFLIDRHRQWHPPASASATPAYRSDISKCDAWRRADATPGVDLVQLTAPDEQQRAGPDCTRGNPLQMWDHGVTRRLRKSVNHG